MAGKDAVNRRLELLEFAQRQRGRDEQIRLHRARRRLFLEHVGKLQALLTRRPRQGQYVVSGFSRTRQRIQNRKVRGITGWPARLERVSGVAHTRVRHSQLNLAHGEHQVVLEGLSDKDVSSESASRLA